MIRRVICALLLLPVSLGGSSGLAAESKRTHIPPAAARPIRFSADIQPILEASCLNCHGRGRDKGGFQLDTRDTTLRGGDSGPAVEPGKSETSLLIRLVSGLDPDSFMPQKGKPLTDEQIGLLRAWIDQGVPWDEGTTFARRSPANLKPRKPEVHRPNSVTNNAIDQILASYFVSNKITADSVVDDRIYARRVHLDIIGLLPGPDALNDFQLDKSPDKRVLLADRLLQANELYAQHWLTFWNDLLRNDYKGTGYIDGGRKQITRWLYSALLTNMPYDRFVAQLVNPASENEGFVKGIVWRGVVNSSQTPEMQAAQNISQVFMGVNIKCASCHDSFINEWKLSDAYGLAAVYHDAPLEMFQCDKPSGKTVGPAFIYPEIGSFEPEMDRSSRVRRLAEILSGPTNGRLPRTIVNRLWAQFFGRGLVEPIDDMDQPAWCQDLLDWLAEDLVSNGYDLKKTMKLIVTSRAYQLPAVRAQDEFAARGFVFRGPAVRRMSAEQFRDAIGQLTGVWYEKSQYGAVTNTIRTSLVVADPLAISLGRPNREQVVTRRVNDPTTLQALELTNGEALAAVLRRGAQVLGDRGQSPRELAEGIFTQALGRPPSDSETSILLEILQAANATAGLEDLLWAVVMLPEFQFVY